MASHLLWKSLLQTTAPEERIPRRRRFAISNFLSSKAHTLAPENFLSLLRSFEAFIDEVFKHVNTPNEILLGIQALEDTLSVKHLIGDEFSQKFLHMLMNLVKMSEDRKITEKAAYAIGRLVSKNGGALSNKIGSQIIWALTCLEDATRQANEKLNAAFFLKSIAEQVPAAFNVHVQTFLNIVWKGLKHHDVELRHASAQAVGACLSVIEKRETRNRVQWFHCLAHKAISGLRSRDDVAWLHGSLLVVSELLRYSGEFMLARYEEVCRQALLLRSHNDVCVTIAVLNLIPRLAEFCPERFVRERIIDAMNIILPLSREGRRMECEEEEAASFQALTGLALSMKQLGNQGSLRNWVQEIAQKLMTAFQKTSDTQSHQEALECCGVLAQCLPVEWKPFAEKLLLPMVMTGLSTSLAYCLQEILISVPDLSAMIRLRLLDVIYLILIDRSLSDDLAPDIQNKIKGFRNVQSIVSALGIISFFDFGEYSLLSFALDHICILASASPHSEVRVAAIKACGLITKKQQISKSLNTNNKGQESDLVLKILDYLIQCGMSDGEESVRYTVWDQFLDSPEVDALFVHCTSFPLLQVGFGDVSFPVQLTCLKFAGRLLKGKILMVQSSVEALILQLLQKLDLMMDNERNQNHLEMLGLIIQSCPSVVFPRIKAVAKSLITVLSVQIQSLNLSEESLPSTLRTIEERIPNDRHPAPKKVALASTGVLTEALKTVGFLADQVGRSLDQDSLQKFMELTVAVLQKPEIEKDSIEAVRTLGKIVSSTGSFTQRYQQFAWLLPRLLDMLQMDDHEVRMIITRTLGILCAIDPSVQRKIQAEASGEGRLELEGVRPVKKEGFESKQLSEKSIIETLAHCGGAIDSEESYAVSAMSSLLRILKQHTWSAFHKDAVHTLGSITQSLSPTSVQYLTKLIPDWCEAVYSGDEELKGCTLEQFIILVKVIKQHIRHCLPNIMKLVKDLWTVNCSKKLLTHILDLLKEVAIVCRHHCHSEFSWLVPRFVLLIETGDWEMFLSTLKTISAFGPSLSQHLHQLLPLIFTLLPSVAQGAPIDLQSSIFDAFEELIPHIDVPELATVMSISLSRLCYRQLQIEATSLDTNRLFSLMCSVIYSCRLDTKAFLSIRSSLQQRAVSFSKFRDLSNYMYLLVDRGAHEAVDLGGNWRKKFETRIEVENPTVPHNHNDQRLLLPNRDLQRCWNAEHVYTYQDWVDWMRSFSLYLLRMSPSPALRACHFFAESIPNMAKDLLPASFVSCWSELSIVGQRDSIRSLEATMAARTIPPELVTTLLNLAEFMEYNGNELPLDKRTLAALSMKCQAFAKALHYKEMEFQENPNEAVEIMLAIYNQCFLPAAASGLLRYARDDLGMQIKDSWYEKLHQWDKALKLYKRTSENAPRGTLQSIEANLGCMRCHSALWDWENLSKMCQEQWVISDPFMRKQIASLAAQAAWKMGQWTEMSNYLEAVDVDKDDTSDAATCSFLYSVSKIHQKQYEEAQLYIDKARQFLSADLAALAGESYERSYEMMVRVQQLSELEEVMHSLQNGHMDRPELRSQIIKYWNARLETIQKRAVVWESCLSVRSLLLNPEEDMETWMRFAVMCRKQDKAAFAKSLLLKFLGYDPLRISKGETGYGAHSGKPEIMLTFLKHLFYTADPSSEMKSDAKDRLMDLIRNDNLEAQAVEQPSTPLISKAYLTLAKWEHTTYAENQSSEHIERLISLTERACQFAPKWAKAWRDWALFHLIAVEYHSQQRNDQASTYVAPAVRGFFTALSLSQESALTGGMMGSGPSKDTYQDILRLLTLWFTHGGAPNVAEELTKGFSMVRIETWIVVIPQIIARIHMRSSHVQDLIHQLLRRIGQAHPQALLYPLLVASCPISGGRRCASLEALEFLRLSYPTLVNEGQLVSRCLVDLAVLWEEKWHESLEEASRLYFHLSDVSTMLSILIPLHQNLLTTQPITNSESCFVNSHADQLNEAYGLLMEYQDHESDATLRKAWDVYFGVFKEIDKSVREMRVLHLSDVAPELLDRSMSVAIPGTYSPFQTEQVCIDRIVPEIQVMRTKQRPRQLTIEGNDGNSYIFLLKGHEDLRQDERVMQLFGLVNTILASNFEASENELSIARYAVTPLSPNVGLIGWVPNCDTLHALIKEYREVKGIPINAEHQRMKSFAPNCEHLMIIQKVEVFEYALDNVSGNDLKNIMWIKSSSSEHWLAHRTNYIRSCAVMSIVGYLLGLGDRHPSNLMIDRYSGKLIHIDFGDCFEAGMHREKFPERVPFRLTRMMVRAMEVAGYEGTFRTTCELVMNVLRNEKLTLMAMLEAFVYDPLINWRLACCQTPHIPANPISPACTPPQCDAHDLLNERAIEVTGRIKLKLSGRELNRARPGISVAEQVNRLIQEATSHVNLCQAYIGWCPFW